MTKPVLLWRQFSANWHLVAQEEGGYRGVCGRGFSLNSPISAVSDTAPTDIRGVCRRCDLLSRKRTIPAPLRRK